MGPIYYPVWGNIRPYIVHLDDASDCLSWISYRPHDGSCTKSRIMADGTSLAEGYLISPSQVSWR